MSQRKAYTLEWVWCWAEKFVCKISIVLERSALRSIIIKHVQLLDITHVWTQSLSFPKLDNGLITSKHLSSKSYPFSKLILFFSPLNFKSSHFTQLSHLPLNCFLFSICYCQKVTEKQKHLEWTSYLFFPLNMQWYAL